MTQEVEEPITEDDAHTEDVETRTTPGADAHSGDDAHKDNAPSRTATFSTRITEEEMERLDAVRNESESKADLLCRLLDEHATFQGRIADLVSNNEHLQKQVDDIRYELESDRQLANERVDDYTHRIEERDQQIKVLELELHDKHTAVVSVGEQGDLDQLGIKDVIEEAREICGDDDTCNSVIGKMIDLKAHFASKAVDHEHSAEQNRLDRDQKELDRKSKEDLAEKDRKFRAEQAEKDQKNKIELALAKKGGFKSEFLEDVVFLSGGSPKQPKKEIERRKQHARHAADDEEEYLGPDAEDMLTMPEEL